MAMNSEISTWPDALGALPGSIRLNANDEIKRVKTRENLKIRRDRMARSPNLKYTVACYSFAKFLQSKESLTLGMRARCQFYRLLF